MSAHVHQHHHRPPEKNFDKAFLIGVLLNSIFVVFEAVFGIAANSLSLVADAGHNLGDVLGLALAWGATVIARRAPTERRTYGFRRTPVLAALANAVVLLVSVGAIMWEAVIRLFYPGASEGLTIVWVAALGIVINAFTAYLFAAGRKADMNIRGAFLHLLSDAVISLGVVIAGIAVLKTGWNWIDPLAGLIISLIIVWSTWDLLRASTNLALDAVPEGIDPAAVKSFLNTLPGIEAVHDLHIWAISTTDTALTAHLVRNDSERDDELLCRIVHDLEHEYGIHHATIQFESRQIAAKCALRPDDVV
jgi:cobalt-zinc-cadmium efflux system protein